MVSYCPLMRDKSLRHILYESRNLFNMNRYRGSMTGMTYTQYMTPQIVDATTIPPSNNKLRFFKLFRLALIFVTEYRALRCLHMFPFELPIGPVRFQQKQRLVLVDDYNYSTSNSYTHPYKTWR